MLTVSFTHPGYIWPRSGTKKQSLRGKQSLVMPDRPAGQHRWRANGSQKFSFRCIVTGDMKLYECPAGCDSDRPERGAEDQQPVSSRWADRGRKHSGWKLPSEERLDWWRGSQKDRVHWNNRGKSKMEQNRQGEWEKFTQKSVYWFHFLLQNQFVCDFIESYVFFILNHVQEGNLEPRLETLSESPIPNLSYSSIAGSRGLPYCNNSFRGQKSIDCVCVCVFYLHGFTSSFCGNPVVWSSNNLHS